MVVDRIVVRADIAQRLAESFETALKLADGLAVVEARRIRRSGRRARDRPGQAQRNEIHDRSGPERLIFSEKFACPVSGFTIPEIEPRLFSFNNPFGACPACGGLGVEQQIDADLVIPDHDLTLRRGAIAPWSRSSSPYYTQTLEALAKVYKFTLDTKWKDLRKKARDTILYGSGDDADPLRLRRRHALVRDQEAVRGRDHQPRAPLAGDRERVDARGDGEVFHATFRAPPARAIGSSPRRCA